MRAQRAVSAATLIAILAAGCLGPMEEPHAPNPAPVSTDDAACIGMLGPVDLRRDTIDDIQQALADGSFTTVDLVKAYLTRVEAFDQRGDNRTLQAIQVLAPDALEQAARLDVERQAGHVRGPLHGIPILLKDNIGTRDLPTTAGSIAFADNIPPHDATVTARLREAGAIILGKLWMSEWAAFGGTKLSEEPRSAYNYGRPGTSSSGPAVAASIAYSPVTLGSETMGSILAPAEANGLVALKPSHGLVSLHGVVPLVPHFDVVGPMGRNVYDVAVALGAMSGSDAADRFSAEADGHLPADGDFTTGLARDALRGVRIGYNEEDDRPKFQEVLERLRQQGAQLVAIPESAGRSYVNLQNANWFNAFHAAINDYLQTEANPDLPFKTWRELVLWTAQNDPDGPVGAFSLAALSAATPGDQALADAALSAEISLARAEVDPMFRDYDLSAVVAFGARTFMSEGARAGYPTVALPLLPPRADEEVTPLDDHALVFFGPRFSDAQLLAYAYAYEQQAGLGPIPEDVNPGILAGICPKDPADPPAPAPEQTPIVPGITFDGPPAPTEAPARGRTHAANHPTP